MTVNVQPLSPKVSGGPTGYPGIDGKGKQKVDAVFINEIIDKVKENEKLSTDKYKKVEREDLGNYLEKLWQRAQETRSQHDIEMVNDIEARMGRYTKPQLVEIDKKNSPSIFMKTTLEKCRALESQLTEVYLSNVRKPWSITHSPEPEIPKKMRNKVIMMAEGVMMNYAKVGQLNQVSKEAVISFAGELMESAKRTLVEEYKKAAEAMEKLIDDQLLESGWRHSMARFIYYFVTCRGGFLKGPILRYKPVSQWKGDKKVTRMKQQFEWEAPNPLDIYPSPDCRDPNKSYIFERHNYSLNQLYSMRGIKGAITENIDILIKTGNKHSPTTGLNEVEQRKREQEEKQQSTDLHNDMYTIMEFSGWISGYILNTYGVPINMEDQTKPFYCNIYFDDNLIYYIHFTDKEPLTKYYMASIEKTPDAFWGEGVPQILSHMQDAINSMIRAAVRNISLAAGPQVVVNDSHRISSPANFEKLEPWRVWVTTQPASGEYTDNAPIEFFQPNIMVNQMLQFYSLLEQRADSLIGVPSYPYDELSGASKNTASGVSIALSQGRQGMKSHLRNIDMNVIEPAIKAMCDLNYDLYPKRKDIKGDIFCKVVGSETDFDKERNLARFNEVLATVAANPLFVELLGIKSVEKLLREIIDIHGIDLGDDLEDQEDRMAAIMQRMAEEQTAQRQQGMVTQQQGVAQGQQEQQGQGTNAANQGRGQPQSRPSSVSKPKKTSPDGSKYGGADKAPNKSDGGKRRAK